MSDHVDNTDKIIFAEVARGLAAVRRRPGLVAVAGTWSLL